MVADTRRAAAKRAQIRRGALAAFLRTGAGTRMDDIATTAGVSKQTLYVYYRSKGELLVDVMASEVAALDHQLPTEWGPVTSGPELRRLLSEVAWGLICRLMTPDYVAMFRLFLTEMVTTPGLLVIWRETIRARFLGRVEELLHRARDAGVVRQVDLDLATRLFVGPLITFVFLDGLARPDDMRIPDRARIDATVDLYLRAVT